MTGAPTQSLSQFTAADPHREMSTSPFVLVAPATRGLALAITRHFLNTTALPVVATHRAGTPDAVRAAILAPLAHVDPARLTLLRLDLASEDSIAQAAHALHTARPAAHLHTALFAGGVLHPERSPADLDAARIADTFRINTISHLLLIKHFARFLPPPAPAPAPAPLAKWVHVSARVGSVSDNRLGGWYAYRASKAALNQVVRTFDLHLRSKRIPAVCVGVHPGTLKTHLSRDFWASVPKEKLFEPEWAAERLVDVIGGLKEEQGGRIWDWAGKEVLP
ncbi:hypothetical protein AcW2_006439 [Taiwanofungus camphoratus]|nr:hypothetical protein AcW2_006439 [Antrodia cinnamomea]